MTYAVLLILQGYREWTESLGSDREWLIQLVQSRLYEAIQSLSKDYDGMALPLRYDIQLVLLPPDIDIDEFTQTLRELLMRYSPTPIVIRACCGDVIEAINKCSRDLDIDYIARCEEYEPLVVAHADLNYFTESTLRDGVVNSYIGIMSYISHLLKNLKDRALVQYLGGDNVVAITSSRNMDYVVKVMTAYDNVKVGVGISLKPREAFAKAAKALTILRREGRVRKYHIIE